jgi:SAM-dependent methyltransferase
MAAESGLHLETQTDREKRWGLTIEDIQKCTISDLALIIDDLSSEGAEPSIPAVQALLSRWIDDQNSRYYTEENATPLPVPYPSSDGRGRSGLKPSRAPADEYDIVKPGTSTLFPRGISYHDDSEVAGQVALPVINRLSAEKKGAAARWLIHLLSKTGVPFDDFDVFHALSRWIMQSDDRVACVGAMLDYIAENTHELHYDQYETTHRGFKNVFESVADSLNYVLYLQKDIAPTLQYISQQPREKMLKMLGILVNVYDFPPVLNKIRELTSDDSQESEQTKKALERLGKMMLGVDPDDDRHPFHKCLRTVYEALHFEEYATNLEADTYETPVLTEILAAAPSEAVHMYFGSGTGRLTHHLAQNGIKNVIGIDTSERNIETARRLNAELPEDYKVDYRIESWDKTSLSSHSVDDITSLGRAFSHVENEDGFENMAREANRILKLGGVMRFDFALNTEGEYRENRERYLQFLKNVGFTFQDDAEALRNIEYVVDSASSPDDPEVHLYNRYMPNQETIVSVLKRCGFQVAELDRRDIVDSKGEKKGTNVYYEAVKVYDYQERKQRIAQGVEDVITKVKGGIPVSDWGLSQPDTPDVSARLEEDKQMWRQAAQRAVSAQAA